MWCDAFDADLPKVVPGAYAIVEPVANVELITHGSTTGGKLNHPTVWNWYSGMVACFGLAPESDPPEVAAKPAAFITSDPVVRCTFWEAVRDAWCHHYIMEIEGVPVWNTFELQPVMMNLMWDVRGVKQLVHDDPEECRKMAEESLREAAERFSALLKYYPNYIVKETTR